LKISSKSSKMQLANTKQKRDDHFLYWDYRELINFSLSKSTDGNLSKSRRFVFVLAIKEPKTKRELQSRLLEIAFCYCNFLRNWVLALFSLVPICLNNPGNNYVEFLINDVSDSLFSCLRNIYLRLLEISRKYRTVNWSREGRTLLSISQN